MCVFYLISINSYSRLPMPILTACSRQLSQLVSGWVSVKWSWWQCSFSDRTLPSNEGRLTVDRIGTCLSRVQPGQRRQTYQMSGTIRNIVFGMAVAVRRNVE